MSHALRRTSSRPVRGAWAFILVVAAADQVHAGGGPDDRVLSGHSGGVTSLAFTGDGRRLISASHDGSLIVWAADRWEPARTLHHGAELYALDVSPGGTIAASAGDDNRMVIWSLEDGVRRRVIDLPGRPLACAFLSEDEVAVGHARGQVLLISAVTGRTTRTIEHGTGVLSLAVARGQGLLAAGPGVKLWDTSRETEPAIVRGVLGFGSLAFSPDGTLLASGDWTGGASIAAVASGSRVATLAHDAQREALGPGGPITSQVNMPVCAVAFSPDGTLLATGGGCTTVKVWSVTSDGTSATLVRTLTGHSMTVTSVAFAPGSRLLASGALDHTVRIWNLADRARASPAGP